MAEAATLTTSPKQVGKQLRAVRRRKGLSLSEVARGAGLSRRELVAYERGKVEIPESDLWVLAGSCGVDVSELMPERTENALTAAPSTIGDSIAVLRAGQDSNGSGRALRAIEAADDTPRYSAPQPVAQPEVEAEAAPAEDSGPVDVFEELARLPEPVPLRHDPEDMPDLLATPDFVVGDNPIAPIAPPLDEAPAATPLLDDAPPPGTFELVDAPPEGTFELIDEVPFDLDDPGAPTVVEMATTEPVERSWSPADAPPIDVALRGETFTEPVGELTESTDDAFATFHQGAVAPAWATAWQPDAQPDWSTATGGVWNEPEGATMVDASGPVELASIATVEALPLSPRPPAGWMHEPDPEATSTGFLVDWGDPEPYAIGPGDTPGSGDDNGTDEPDGPPLAAAAVDVETPTWDTPAPTSAFDAAFAESPTWESPGDLELDPLSTGTEPSGWDAAATAEPWEPAPAWDGTLAEPAYDREATYDAEPATDTETDDVDETDDADDLALTPLAAEDLEGDPALPTCESEPTGPEPDDDVIPPISWHPEPVEIGPAGVYETALAAAAVLVADAPIAAPVAGDTGLSTIAAEQWTVAGDDWELGNALPLVEVRGQGALVMRRADERWALADLTVASETVVEVDLEFRSGPGFGVLFRADVDDDGRMSAYSFDIDPVYEGGAFLVRQWQADRELWNPIAHVPVHDTDAMRGRLTVRLELAGERLVALVNGEAVLVVDDLRQGSLDRGRDAPAGTRVGVQAWSSSDLVIETLRVADR